MTKPTNLSDFLADWQRREDEARNDPHHAKDHEHAAWLVANAAGIRAVVEALWRERECAMGPKGDWENFDSATSATDAAIAKLVAGEGRK